MWRIAIRYLEKGEELDLGTITVDSEENVRISVDRDDFQGVNSFHEKLEVTNFGEYEDYEMILETPEPEEPETEDPETPEPEAPDTPDEDTEDDDSDRNSGRGNSRSEWTEKPNGSWKQDGRGWWFAKLDGSYPADGWFECSWNGKKGWYHFNAEGYMETGWFTDKDGHTYFLHDGRARNLTEAIMWHGGEGEASKNLFKQMSKEEREAVIAFLNSL